MIKLVAPLAPTATAVVALTLSVLPAPYQAEGRPATAPAPDSDCSGAVLTYSPSYPWSIGLEDIVRGYEPVLYFQSKESALDCRGSSDYDVRVFRGGRWVH